MITFFNCYLHWFNVWLYWFANCIVSLSGAHSLLYANIQSLVGTVCDVIIDWKISIFQATNFLFPCSDRIVSVLFMCVHMRACVRVCVCVCVRVCVFYSRCTMTIGEICAPHSVNLLLALCLQWSTVSHLVRSYKNCLLSGKACPDNRISFSWSHTVTKDVWSCSSFWVAFTFCSLNRCPIKWQCSVNSFVTWWIWTLQHFSS
jgi:hypothetical protein